MDQRVIDLYDDYTHARIDRRTFLARITEVAGGTAAAMAMIESLRANPARAALTSADDERLVIERITYEGASGPVAGYLARPRDAGDVPAVIVIHENRGLNAHIEDVARRAALDGFLALAPDLLSPLGGTPEDEDLARELIGQLQADAVVEDLRAAVAWLRNHDSSSGRVGSVGFCWGGGISGRLATAEPELDAAVVFYGAVPPIERVPDIQARLLLHYAEHDQRINARVPEFEDALKAAGVPYALHMYPGTQHAFHNDTSEARYDADAARLAWQRTMAFFHEALSA